MSTAQQFCTFFLGPLYMGVEVEKVLEVIRFQETTRVPRAPDCVRGLINLRGEIVGAIDLRLRLELAPSTETAEPVNVVLHRDGGPVSLLVDEIGDVMTTDQSKFEPAPNTISPTVREMVEGVYKTDKELLLVLDTENVVQLTT